MKRLAKLMLLAAMILTVAACESKSTTISAPVVCTFPPEPAASHVGGVAPGHADLSGSTRLGKASFYAQNFANRLMANGRRMDPRGDNAASRTLPLGTTAKVINMRTGQSAIVSIDDRGPYVKGRIVDLSPATARQIGITQRVGVAEVKIAPLWVPLPDGSIKPGSGVHRVPVCKVYRS
jgi:rare lipoprotein A